MGTRKIIHVDMDAFYASVEQRDDPSLKGKCVIVGGAPNSRGVVCTASYEARQFGVRSAMASAKAYKLCPEGVFVKPNFIKYKEASQQMKEIFLEYTDQIEPISLDEAFLDVTHNFKNISSASQIAKEIKEKIEDQLQLTASCGVAPNKLIAKIASDFDKPDGLVVVPPEKVHEFIVNLNVSKIPGVGKVTKKKLSELGLETFLDIQKSSKALLSKHLGIFGSKLFDLAHGIDNRSVKSFREAKSIGSELTLPEDLLNINEINSYLKKEIEQVVTRLDKKDVVGKTVTLKVKYYNFTTITRSITLGYAVSDFDSIYNICQRLLLKTLVGQIKIRLIGLSISKLSRKMLVDNETQFLLPFN